MKILLVNSLYAPHAVGGAERSVRLLAESLVERGHAVTVATLCGRGQDERVGIDGVEVRRIGLENLYFPFTDPTRPLLQKLLWQARDVYNPTMAAHLRRHVEEVGPDVVNTHNLKGFSGAVWPAIKSCGVPLVHTLRDLYLLCPRGTQFHRGRVCASRCMACRLACWPRVRASRHVDAVVGISRFILDHHVAQGCFPTSGRFVIGNSVPPAPSLPPPRDPAAESRPLQLGYLGGLLPHKGVELLLAAFLSLPEGSAELWVGGRGDSTYEARLRGLGNGSRGLHWLGFVPPEDVLGRVDVLVVPSLWHEAFGRVVIEAFARGIPVVVSRRGGLPELVTDATGWTFDPNDSMALSVVLREILALRRRLASMGEAVRERARAFDGATMTRAYHELYEGLIPVAGPPRA